ncbi:MAG TPA: YihY/virulence factor BrkB family protein, partial [Saprospiraceae bacterium]|nr:YihY/virulence factor BrkB family protein [Saprospiraceae bacterium]
MNLLKKLSTLPQHGLNLLKLIKQAAIEFHYDGATKMSAALSYYTLFSIAPMLIIVIAVSSIWLGKEAAEGYLYQQFEGLMGTTASLQVQEMIRNVYVSGDTPWVTVLGVATLIFGATGVFVEIQDSVNTIWSLKAKPKRGWLKFLKNRLLSFSLVIGIGFLLLVSLVVSAMLSVVNDWLTGFFSQTAWVAALISNCISLLTVMLLFSVIFKVLPDAKLQWKDVLVGAFATTLLFLGGKYLINLYLSKSSAVSAYGAAGAVVLLILWVYYSSVILYFGAEFTKVYANLYGSKIRPSAYAVFIEKKEIIADQPVLAEATQAVSVKKV